MTQKELEDQRSFFKSVGVMSLMTFLSRILGLVREMVKAHYLGTSFYSDAFTLAFALPNLFRRLTAEGAMSNAFIPVFCEIKAKEGEKRAFDFARDFFWLSSLFLTLFALFFILFAPWLVEYVFAAGFSGETLDLTVFLTRFMFFYILFISLAAICQGVLNSFSIFWVSAVTPILLNITIIGMAAYFAPKMADPTFGFALGVLVGGALQLLFQIPFIHKAGVRLFKGVNFRDPYFKKVFLLMLPAVFGVGVYQLNIIVSNLIATTLKEGSLSSLTFSNRLMELIIGIFIISIATVLLPRFSNLIQQGKSEEVARHLGNSLQLIAYITLPVMAGAFILSEEIVSILFLRGRFDENSLSMTSGALRFHLYGLVFIAWNRVLLTGYQAAQRIKRTVQISFFAMIVNLVLAFVLAQWIGHLGIALANSVSQVVQAILLLVFLRELAFKGIYRQFFDVGFIKIMVINLILVAVIWTLQVRWAAGLEDIWARLVVQVFAGVVSYLFLSWVFKVGQLTEFTKMLFKRQT